jgi:putative tryptophan/tyrosine transport system substrate-binding protein
MEIAARRLKIDLQVMDLRGSDDVQARLDGEELQRINGMVVLQNPIAFARRAEITRLAAKSRMPAIYPATEFVEAGGLMGYGIDVGDLFRRAGIYAAKIIKGAKPMQLSVDGLAKLNLVINLRTAKEIGIAVPHNILLSADRIIR